MIIRRILSYVAAFLLTSSICAAAPGWAVHELYQFKEGAAHSLDPQCLGYVGHGVLMGVLADSQFSSSAALFRFNVRSHKINFLPLIGSSFNDLEAPSPGCLLVNGGNGMEYILDGAALYAYNLKTNSVSKTGSLARLFKKGFWPVAMVRLYNGVLSILVNDINRPTQDQRYDLFAFDARTGQLVMQMTFPDTGTFSDAPGAPNSLVVDGHGIEYAATMGGLYQSPTMTQTNEGMLFEINQKTYKTKDAVIFGPPTSMSDPSRLVVGPDGVIYGAVADSIRNGWALFYWNPTTGQGSAAIGIPGVRDGSVSNLVYAGGHYILGTISLSSTTASNIFVYDTASHQAQLIYRSPLGKTTPKGAFVAGPDGQAYGIWRASSKNRGGSLFEVSPQ